jgi:hypothetical protein
MIYLIIYLVGYIASFIFLTVLELKDRNSEEVIKIGEGTIMLSLFSWITVLMLFIDTVEFKIKNPFYKKK